MASRDEMAFRSVFTAEAFATMGTDPVWDARVAEYLRWEGLQRAETTFGETAKTDQARDMEQWRLEAVYGPRWRSNPKALALLKPLSAASKAAEEKWTVKLCEPYWQAARDLAMTPAPTLAAALFKVHVITWDELDNDACMTRDPFEIVAEDFARLAGGA